MPALAVFGAEESKSNSRSKWGYPYAYAYEGDEVSPHGITVGELLPGGQAEQCGVRRGSRAVAIVGRAMRFFYVEDVENALVAALAAHQRVAFRFMAPKETSSAD